MKKKPRHTKEQEKQVRAWEAWHRELLEEALAGVHRDVFERLMERLKSLGEARALVDAIAREDWSAVDAEQRAIALFEIDRAIVQLREKRGLGPIDDPLPGQPDNAFRHQGNVREFPAICGRACRRQSPVSW